MFLVRNLIRNSVVNTRNFSFSPIVKCSITEDDTSNIEIREITKDRSEPIALETSIKYLESRAYFETYGDKPVWTNFRRNFKGQIPPKKTRRKCIRKNEISTGSPCPICRDEYLVIDYRNIKLLKQFISPYTGAVINYQKTNICQQQHDKLLIAISQAKDRGLLTFDVPHRNYQEYSEFYKGIN